MLTQICLDFAGLPDVRTLDTHEIRGFYDRLRPSLLARGKKRG